MDAETTKLLDYCMEYVEGLYLKVVRIDFKDGSFDICKLADGVNVPDVSAIQEWVDYDLEKGIIHPQDVEKFKTFADLTKLRKLIQQTDRGIYCSYRRMNPNGNYIHISMCVVRDKEHYCEDHEYGILYVKDINSIYEAEYECILEDLGTKDSFTQLLNRFAFQRDASKYSGGNVGVLFADLNGLKHINDTEGHAAGDKLILDFANLLKRAFADYKIYHISGDEFIVVAYDTNLRSFLQRVLGWHRWIWETGDHPLAAIGYSLDTNVKDVCELVTDAENAMYVDKDIFYNRYPQYKRT